MISKKQVWRPQMLSLILIGGWSSYQVTDVVLFLSCQRLLFMEEPRKWLLVCAGPLLRPGWIWQKTGDHADPYQGEPQGGQALWVPVWQPPLPWEEADPVCGFHAHQRTLFLPVTIPSTWEELEAGKSKSMCGHLLSLWRGSSYYIQIWQRASQSKAEQVCSRTYCILYCILLTSLKASWRHHGLCLSYNSET